MNKTITINPKLFEFPSKSSSRKKRKSSDGDDATAKIKVKMPKNGKEAGSVADGKRTKRALLKYIRNKQEADLEKTINRTKNADKKDADSTFNSDFEESLKYMSSVTEQYNKSKPNQTQNQNHTLKHRTTHIDENVSLSLSDFPQGPVYDSTKTARYTNVGTHIHEPIQSTNTVFHPTSVPQFGCLKGGKLPTYRTWKNKTRQNRPNIGITEIPAGISRENVEKEPDTILSNVSTKADPIITHLSEMKQNINTFKHPKKPKPIVTHPRQKRIARRTFRLGKSRHYPRVSVLVSNKTIRNNTTNKIHELKQVPMQEVKRFLVKRGLIKVGTVAPNDVLRKMYESVSLICGEIKNHNPENMLYNFFNDIPNK